MRYLRVYASTRSEKVIHNRPPTYAHNLYCHITQAHNNHSRPGFVTIDLITAYHSPTAPKPTANQIIRDSAEKKKESYQCQAVSLAKAILIALSDPTAGKFFTCCAAALLRKEKRYQ